MPASRRVMPCAVRAAACFSAYTAVGGAGGLSFGSVPPSCLVLPGLADVLPLQALDLRCSHTRAAEWNSAFCLFLQCFSHAAPAVCLCCGLGSICSCLRAGQASCLLVALARTSDDLQWQVKDAAPLVLLHSMSGGAPCLLHHAAFSAVCRASLQFRGPVDSPGPSFASWDACIVFFTRAALVSTAAMACLSLLWHAGHAARSSLWPFNHLGRSGACSNSLLGPASFPCELPCTAL